MHQLVLALGFKLGPFISSIFLISAIGLSTSLVIMGLGVLFLTPLILFIPKLKEFIGSPYSDIDSFFERHYPGAFENEKIISTVTTTNVEKNKT